MIAPSALLEIVRDAAEKFPDDIDSATKQVVSKWRKHAERDEWRDRLEEKALREILSDYRHSKNVAIRAASGGYSVEPQRGKALDALAKAATDTILDMTVGGLPIRDILGKQLGELASGQLAISDTHRKIARFLTRLSEIVGPDEKVGDVVSDTKAQSLWMETERNGKHKTNGKAVTPAKPKTPMPARAG